MRFWTCVNDGVIPEKISDPYHRKAIKRRKNKAFQPQQIDPLVLCFFIEKIATRRPVQAPDQQLIAANPRAPAGATIANLQASGARLLMLPN